MASDEVSRSEFQQDLAAHLHKHKTESGMQQAILKATYHWLHQCEDFNASEIQTHVLPIIQAQSEVGWYQFFLGRFD